MSNDSVAVTEVVKVDLPEPLIYANADEFHVKSTVVYAGEIAETGGNLYLDKALTKPVYNDKLERLFLAGGLKIAVNDDNGDLFVFSALDMRVYSTGENTVVQTTSRTFVAHARPTDDSSNSSDGILP